MEVSISEHSDLNTEFGPYYLQNKSADKKINFYTDLVFLVIAKPGIQLRKLKYKNVFCIYEN